MFGLSFTAILSDGDLKIFMYLKEKQVYGANIIIQKEECVNNVSKRLGTALRKVVPEWRTKGITLGRKVHGSLKEETIFKMAWY